MPARVLSHSLQHPHTFQVMKSVCPCFSRKPAPSSFRLIASGCQFQQPGVFTQPAVLRAAAVHHQCMLPARHAQQHHAVPGAPARPGNALRHAWHFGQLPPRWGWWCAGDVSRDSPGGEGMAFSDCTSPASASPYPTHKKSAVRVDSTISLARPFLLAASLSFAAYYILAGRCATLKGPPDVAGVHEMVDPCPPNRQRMSDAWQCALFLLHNM